MKPEKQIENGNTQTAMVIEADHISMCYRAACEESGSLKEYLIRFLQGKQQYRDFFAVNDVSFAVNKGEIMGIIGVNGSGKSILLKIIAGVLEPTSGSIRADRSKIQLLTLGSGFDPELTARENVYLNGALIGYSREFIDKKYEEIVEFAELGNFMNEKIKKFSSGMISRLGFAIATARDTPEILLLDEVLSVGDTFFRRKSELKMQSMIKSGSTVLMVSHSMDVIRRNCTRVIWLEKGALKQQGTPEVVCASYLQSKKNK